MTNTLVAYAALGNRVGNQPDGLYLVRHSATARGAFGLTVYKEGKPNHFRVDRFPSGARIPIVLGPCFAPVVAAALLLA